MISTLNTHGLVKDLKASGFTDAQAEAVTRAVRQSQDLSGRVTKSDLALRTSELRSETREVRAELVALEPRLIKWMTGIGITATLAVGGMVRAATRALFPGSATSMILTVLRTGMSCR